MNLNGPLLDSDPPISLREVLKWVMVALVAGATAAKPNFADGSTWEVICEVVIGIGAVSGIVSGGLNGLRRKV